MDLEKMIIRRRSVRKYEAGPLKEDDVKKINGFIQTIKPLYPHIRTKIQITGKESIRTIMPWITDQVITMFSEEKDGYLENTGFMLQQLDLFLQAEGMGTCWIGLAKNRGETKNADGLRYVIMLSVGYTGEPERKGAEDFNRKELSDISNTADPRLEPARLAPSSTNSQPWYFVSENDGIHVFYTKPGLLSVSKARSDMHIIDIGIALAHLYVSNPDTFSFDKYDPKPQYNGLDYIGTVKI